MVRSLARADRLALISLVCTAAIIALMLRNLAVDDAFVTYRYAFNLAHEQGYVYNHGQALLSTTAPFYGLLLALFAWLGLDVPTVSNIISALSIGAGGMLLYAIGRRRGRELLGWIAGMLYILNPLLWLSLGMETAFVLALILAAFTADEYRMSGLAGVALGAAFATRYDSALPAAIIFLRQWWHSRRSAIQMAWCGAVVALPVLVLLTLVFGSPLPVTLLAKRAQNALGVTGFYANTTFVQGLLILLHGWFEQTWLYAVSGIAIVGGLVLALRRERWVLPYALWACAHTVAYLFLGSAPYYWYYAPLVPAAVWLVALAVEWITNSNFQSPISNLSERSRRSSEGSGEGGDPAGLAGQSLISIVALLLVFAPFAYSLAAIGQAQSGPLPDSTTDASKVLPESKVDVYRRVGEWVATNTPPTATLGATEIGVIGYYAQRDMIDFLGLLQPDVAEELAHGDPQWALFAYQPDYVVLNAVNPIYTFDPRRDDWFRAAYRPVQRFDDERFWASPMVVYRRETPRTLEASSALPAGAISANANFGDSITLVGVEPSVGSLQPGEPLAVRLWWRYLPADRDYALSVQLLGQDDLIIAQRESHLTMTAHPPSVSAVGTTLTQVALIGLPEAACTPDVAQLNIVLYDFKTGARLSVTDSGGRDLGDSFRVGQLAIRARGDAGNQLNASFGHALTLIGLHVSPRMVQPGGTIRVTQNWRQGEAWREGLAVFVHLLSEDGQIVAQVDSPASVTGEDQRELKVPPDTPEGVYRLQVGVYEKERGKRLPWLDAVGQPLGDSLALCPVRVW